ncbi:hypothetical protein [uncultured Roseibium sp.]|uniref:hypothetical protein n=1 Tax=uncultured Roseibium sp. TaxID=1936171 RepID=UPI00321726C6
MLHLSHFSKAGVRLAAAAVIGLSGLASASAQTKWDMPTPYGDSNFHTVNIAEFAKDVSDKTSGSLTIQIHSAGSLFKHPEIKNAVRKGPGADRRSAGVAPVERRSGLRRGFRAVRCNLL